MRLAASLYSRSQAWAVSSLCFCPNLKSSQTVYKDCSSGGAYQIGLPTQDVSGAGQAPVFDVAHDAHLALRQWRVNGTKPTEFIGSAYKGTNASSGIAYTRRICLWPKVGVYNGSGNKTDYTSYTCQ